MVPIWTPRTPECWTRISSSLSTWLPRVETSSGTQKGLLGESAGVNPMNVPKLTHDLITPTRDWTPSLWPSRMNTTNLRGPGWVTSLKYMLAHDDFIMNLVVDGRSAKLSTPHLDGGRRRRRFVSRNSRWEGFWLVTTFTTLNNEHRGGKGFVCVCGVRLLKFNGEDICRTCKWQK